MSLANVYVVNANKGASRTYQYDSDNKRSESKKNAYDNLCAEKEILSKCSDHNHVGPFVSQDEKMPEIGSEMNYCMRWKCPSQSLSKITKLPLFVIFIYRPKTKPEYCVWHHVGNIVEDAPNREWSSKDKEYIISLSDPIIITTRNFLYESLHYWNFRSDKESNYPGYTEATYNKNQLGFTRGNNLTVMVNNWMISSIDTTDRLFDVGNWLGNWYPTRTKCKKSDMRIEHVYLKFISNCKKFKSINWKPQRYVKIKDENKKRYLDFMFVGSSLVILEIDERSHKDRDPQEELDRMEQIIKGIISEDKSLDIPFVFIRVNPHHQKADIEKTMNMVYDYTTKKLLKSENIVYVNYGKSKIPKSVVWNMEIINY